MTAASREGTFLDLVYNAALEPELWAEVIEQFAEMTGGEHSVLTEFNIETGAGAATIIREGDPAVLSTYFDHYAAINPHNLVKNFEDYSRNWAPSVVLEQDLLPRDEIIKTEYFNDFLRPIRAEWSMFVRLAKRDDVVAAISIGRSNCKGAFGRPEVEAAGRVQAHLIRSFALGKKLATTRGLQQSLVGALDSSPHAMFVLDEKGVIRYANRVAEQLLRRQGGLCQSAGRLDAASPPAAATLAALIGAAGSFDQAQRRGGSMSLNAPGRTLPLTLTVSPVRSEQLALLDVAPAVLVCVNDPQPAAGAPERRLREMFSLTGAEAKVALGLLEGLNPKGIAAVSGASVFTVRTQLGSIFNKTGVHRQADLVRLLMSAVSIGVS